jgi:hypothetical protein
MDEIIRHRKHDLLIAAIVMVLSVLVWLGYSYLPYGIDWSKTIRPACLLLLQGKSPYEIIPNLGFPPWALAALIPLTVFSDPLGRAILFTIGLVCFLVSIMRMGAKPIVAGAFLLSPPVMHNLLNANLDWLPLIGFTLPPRIGLFFISVKPQMGSVVGLFWLIEAYRKGGVRQVIKDFLPFTLALFISFLLFGFWPIHYMDIQTTSQTWNASLWPASIPVGLALAVASIRMRDIRLAMGASPCLSPYVLLHAWSGALAALAKMPIEMLAAVAGLWILVILQAFK